MSATATTVDCLGLACPIPVVRLARAVASVEVGSVVELLADDPGYAEAERALTERLAEQQALYALRLGPALAAAAAVGRRDTVPELQRDAVADAVVVPRETP